MSHGRQAEAELRVGMGLMSEDGLRAQLSGLYPRPQRGGSPRRDVVMLFRVLLVQMATGEKSINRWVERLWRESSLRELVCLQPGEWPPGVATLYDFVYRMMGGRRGISGPEPHRSARAEERTVSARRAAAQLRVMREEQRSLSEGAGAALARLEKHRAKEARAEGQAQGVELCNAVLLESFVKVSRERGLLPESLRVSLDGTVVETQASSEGRTPPGGQPRDWTKPETPLTVSTPRTYGDPLATWTWHASKERWCFGHRVQLLVSRHGRQDLPLWMGVESARSADVLMGVTALSTCVESLRDTGLRIEDVVADKAYDARAMYTLAMEEGFGLVVPRVQGRDWVKEAVELNEEGQPLCPAGVPMRLHGKNKRQACTTYKAR